MSTQPGDRRALIAASGIRIIARDGVRSLTHRAVDREAGIPQGSTSYHARTRNALVELIVDELTTRSAADAASFSTAFNDSSADVVGPEPLAARLAGLIERLANRRDDMKARYALMLELDDDSELRLRLTTHSDVQDIAENVTADALAQAGLPHTQDHVRQLLTLTDALLLYRTTIGDPTADTILGTYLRGTLG